VDSKTLESRPIQNLSTGIQGLMAGVTVTKGGGGPGVGGGLIARLLEKCPWVKNGVNLVLQPMTKWDVLRKWLYANGFEVKKELACTEGQFAYSVMQAVYTGKTPSYECDDRYLQFGFVKPEGEGKEYIARQAKRIFVAGSGMMKSEDKKELGERLVKLAQSELDRL